MKTIYAQSSATRPVQPLARILVNVLLAMVLTIASPFNLFAQQPVIGYSSPHSYTAGVVISSLTPTNTGGAVAGATGGTVTLASGITGATGIAVDAAGNVYMTDGFRVYKVSAGGGPRDTISTGFGVAADLAGNVYFTDQDGVHKIPAAGGAPVLIGSGTVNTTGNAVDANGNVYLIEGKKVYKIPLDGSDPISIGSGLNVPEALAVDGKGNIYVTDVDALKVISPGGATATLISGVYPLGVAVDGIGNVYFTEYDPFDPSKDGVREIPAQTIAVGATPVYIGSGFLYPTSIAVNAIGNVYVVESSGVKKIVGGYYVGPALPAGLSIDSSTGVISGRPTAASITTGYSVVAFNSGGNSSAIVNIGVTLPPQPSISYSGPQTFTMGVPIAPLVPTSHNVDVLGYLNAPGTIASGLGVPSCSAIDAAGNIYVVDNNGKSIKKIRAGDGTTTTIGTGFDFPDALAVDAAGNVYVADLTQAELIKISATGSDVSIGSGLYAPKGVAADAAGNVYVADYGNLAVKKIPVGGGVPVTILSGVKALSVAVDYAGNLYVGVNADSGMANGSIREIMAPITPASAVITLATGFIYPNRLAIDLAGNVYVNESNAKIKEIPSAGGEPVTLLSDLNGAVFGALDVKGNMYVTNDDKVEKIKPIGGYFITPVLPSGLTFNANTGVISGTPTIASDATNYNIVAYNVVGSSSATVNIKVGVVGSPGDATLSNLIVSSGALAPVFTSGTNNYTDNVTNSTSSIFVTPTATVATSTIKVNGVAVASGALSGNIHLDVDNNVIPVVVTAADGTTTKTYSVTVIRKSNDATLSSLTLSTGTLNPVFAGSTITYTALVGNSTSSITLTPTKNNTYATISVNGSTVNSGAASPAQALAVGTNVIQVVVTAQNGAVKTYTVTVTRLSNDATLSALTLSHGTLNPAFSSTTVNYSASVSNATTSITLKPTKNNAYASISINGSTVNSGSTSPAQALAVGANPIKVVVTAQNGAVKTYTVTVTRLASALAALSNLTISSGTLSPTFTPGTISYADTVNNGTASVTVTPTQSNASAVTKVNGAVVASGTASTGIPLVVGLNTISVVVNASDGTITYTVKVLRKSNDATLSALTLSSGTLNPVFAGTTVNYTATVSNSVSSITLTPTKNNAYATIAVNGNAVASGTASAAQPLVVGTNVIQMVVTAQNGAVKTYTVTVTRQSNDATLSALTLSSGTLSPAFAGSTVNYTASVGNSFSSITLTPTKNNTFATISINGSAVNSGTASPAQALAVGANAIKVIVTAQNGATKTYTVNVIRLVADAMLSNLTISSGTLSPTFTSGTISYADTVNNSTASVTVTPTSSNAAATIKVNGTATTSGAASASIPLAVGLNSINVVVTAPDGTATYTIKVMRKSNDATLSALTLSDGTLSPVFVGNTVNYTASVSNATSSITLTPTKNNTYATITVNGSAVTSGTASAAQAITVGSNLISVVVTAQNGATKTYKVTVTRASGGLNSLYLPGSGEQTPLVSSLGENVEANNILSPNGDGINDIWVVKNIAFYPNNKVTVYNRAGEVVFTEKGYANDWDGAYRGSKLSEGSYYYLIELGNGDKIKGFITVVAR